MNTRGRYPSGIVNGRGGNVCSNPNFQARIPQQQYVQRNIVQNQYSPDRGASTTTRRTSGKTKTFLSSASFIAVAALSFMVVFNSLVSLFDANRRNDRVGFALQLEIAAVASLFLSTSSVRRTSLIYMNIEGYHTFYQPSIGLGPLQYSPQTQTHENMVRRSGVVGKKKPAGYIIIILAALIVLGCEADADQKYYYNCNNPSPCRKFVNISHPFRLEDDPPDCGGDHRYNLSCEKNRTVLHWHSGKYYVESISYETQTMRVVDSGLQIDNCSSLPLHSFTFLANFREPYLSLDYQLADPFFYPLLDDPDPFFYPLWHGRFRNNSYVVFMTCESPITSTAKYPHLVNTSPCINASSSSGSHSYAFVGDEFRCSDVPDSCTIGDTFPILYWDDDDDAGRHNRPFSQIHHQLAMGFQLSWARIDYGSCNITSGLLSLSMDHFHNFYCHPDSSCGNFIRCFTDDYWPNFYDMTLPSILVIIENNLKYLMVARTSTGFLCLLTLLIYMLQRRHFSMDTNIEQFLQEHNNLMLIQYSYSDIKKMSKHFSDKLGRGGFGSVYKGKLRSGNLAAIKMLENSKGNGQDFISEVSTIGRIHHVNVVQLIGFCFEGSKRALVYDFMPNGSLDKYIFSTQEQASFSLSWEKMYKIALGVAHGIEYLHRGCDMQILHFDIKPHNILLNEDFTPKISDFGLAKLYPTNENTVPLTGARGTIGYIAPELVYKSMGGVSYKADVYSFGMLLMEMAGRRKNVNPFANSTSSQVYFPSWIYEKLNRGEDMEMEDATEEEKQIVRKMIIVALSCIQLKPSDRPSMSGVIEMLESPTELLQMPRKPFLGSSFERVEEARTIMEPSTSSLKSSSFSNYSLEIQPN